MIETAIEAAKKGGEIALKYFETELEHEIKDDKSFVTKADKEAEAAILEVLKAKFPDHAFLAEETGESENKAEFLWVIDPIDGTANFVNGLPLWAISIGLVKNGLSGQGEPVAAVVYNPVMNLLVHAEKGKGLWCNDVRLNVSKQEKDKAMITAGVGRIPGVKDKLTAFLKECPNHIKTYRYIGSAALELALVARGGTEGFVAFGNSKWDYAAGVLLIEEGGGKITDFRGNPCGLGENFFIASNGIVHNDIIEIIRAAGIA